MSVTSRSYEQFCGVARALDLVGERWALLIVRDLILGPKRFTDLRRGLPGIGTNVLAARLRGAIAGLTRVLDGVPDGLARATELLARAGEAATIEGHPICAGLRSLRPPGDPVGDFWRAADVLREHRGDSHVAAWVSHGVDAVEITLLTELWWRLRCVVAIITYLLANTGTTLSLDLAKGPSQPSSRAACGEVAAG